MHGLNAMELPWTGIAGVPGALACCLGAGGSPLGLVTRPLCRHRQRPRTLGAGVQGPRAQLQTPPHKPASP